MKKFFLTMVVVLTLLLAAIGVSMAAPDDIPDAFGPCSTLPEPVVSVPSDANQPTDNL